MKRAAKIAGLIALGWAFGYLHASIVGLAMLAQAAGH